MLSQIDECISDRIARHALLTSLLSHVFANGVDVIHIIHIFLHMPKSYPDFSQRLHHKMIMEQ